MLGMYPPDGSFTEVVELHTKDTTYDYITANSKFVHAHMDTDTPTHLSVLFCRLCPKFGVYETMFKNSSVWKNHQNVTTSVLNAISKAIDFTVGKLLEVLVTQNSHCIYDR